MEFEQNKLLENLNRKYFCKIHVLITSLSEEHTEKLKEVVSAYSRNASIVFVDVAKECKKMAGMFHMRDYYSQETYFRFFISPQQNTDIFSPVFAVRGACKQEAPNASDV